MSAASAEAPDTREVDRQLAAELARTWVENLTEQLASAGRPLEGGWPGTLTEARRLLATKLATPSPAMSPPRFERLVKAIYDDAKSQWLAHANRRPTPRFDE